MSKVMIIGCGGIGCRLVHHFHHTNTPLILVDGDVVEHKNLDRQFFTESDIDSPKVEALGSPNDTFIPEYIHSGNIFDIILEALPTALFVAVDNHTARQDILVALKEIAMEFSFRNWGTRTPIIFMGNAESSGEAVYSTARKLYYDTLYPDVLLQEHHDSPLNPCSEASSRGDTQTPLANLGASTLGLMLYSWHLEHKRESTSPYAPIRYSFGAGRLETLTLRDLNSLPDDVSGGIDIDD